MIAASSIEHPPQSGTLQIDVEPGFGFGSGQHRLPHPEAPAGVILRQSLGDEAINHQAVGGPVYIDIESWKDTT